MRTLVGTNRLVSDMCGVQFIVRLKDTPRVREIEQMEGPVHAEILSSEDVEILYPKSLKAREGVEKTKG